MVSILYIVTHNKFNMDKSIWHNTKDSLPEENREILYQVKATNNYHEYHECGIYDNENNEFVSNMTYYTENEIECWCYVDEIT